MISAATPGDLYFAAGTSWDLTPQQFLDMKIELLSKIGGMLSVLGIAGALDAGKAAIGWRQMRRKVRGTPLGGTLGAP